MLKNVNRGQLVLTALATASFVCFLPVQAAPGGEKGDGADSNIFSTPDSDAEPGYTADKSGGGRFRKMIYGEGRDALPNFHQVRSIPSLSQAQRQEIHKIYGNAKSQVEPLVEQLKQMKAQAGGDGQKALGDPQNRGKFQELRAQVKAVHEQTWQKVKGTLNEQQLQELEAMKKGEMQPATFNPPQVGFGGRRAQYKRNAGPEGTAPMTGTTDKTD